MKNTGLMSMRIFAGKGNGVEDQIKSEAPVKMIPGVEAWVGALAVCRGSDLAASGAGDGKVQLWALEEDNKHLRALHSLPVVKLISWDGT